MLTHANDRGCGRVLVWLLGAALGLAPSLGCGGDDGPSRTYILETAEPGTPYIVTDDEATVWAFHADPGTGAPTGITLIARDGREGSLRIDPATGDATSWVADGYVLTFTNWRHAEGLVDVGLVSPDGTWAVEQDLAFPSPDEPLTTVTLALETTAESGEVRPRWGQFFGAISLVISSVGCAGGVIITGGSTIASSPIPPLSVPIFATTSAGTAIACGTAVTKFRALTPDNSTASLVNDTVVAPAELGQALYECGSRGLKNGVTLRTAVECLLGGAEVVFFSSGGTLSRLSASVLAVVSASDDEPSDPLKVYCCNGPDQLAQGKSGTWRAAVVEGTGTLPFTYQFNWGDGGGTDWLNSSSYGLNQTHSYLNVGTYTLAVGVRDALGAQAEDNAGVGGALATRTVKVYRELSASCCTVSSLEEDQTRGAGDRLTFDYQIRDGRAPYHLELLFGDGDRTTRRLGMSQRPVEHHYKNPGTYTVSLIATDADGTVFHAPPFTHTVVDETPEPEPNQPTEPTEDCLAAAQHLCSRIVGQGCNTATMDNAVNGVKKDCGKAMPSGFASRAEAYCSGNPTFTVNGCVSAVFGGE